MKTTDYQQVHLVGSYFRGRDVMNVVAGLEPGETFVLEREPENPHDANAIKVIYEEIFVGYIERNFASWIARDLDAGWQVKTCVMTEMGENAKGKPEPILSIVLYIEGDEATAERETPLFSEVPF